MPTLPAFWHAAALLGPRLDLGPVLDRLPADQPIETCQPAQLAAAGLPPQHALALHGRPAVQVPVDFLTLADPAYPAALRPLPAAPPVLFYRGELARLKEPGLAIVGTRRCTALGRQMARTLASAVACAGGVVISGLAYGIDAEAHAAAPGRTVAVLGQGLGLPLQGHQRRLGAEILAEGGLLVTEFLPAQPPTRWTFPQRNRVIAGLAAAVLVVEAGLRSGALITARNALEVGRDVLAVPGSPLCEASMGCLGLLADGARVVRGAADALEALQITAGAAQEPALDPALARLYAAIAAQTGYEELLRLSGLEPRVLDQALATLELCGLVRRLPGDRYCRQGN